MLIDTEGMQQRAAVKRLLALIGVLGLVLIIFSYSDAALAIPRLPVSVAEDIGKALIVAAVLGWIVDSALKHDLIRDAVASAIGYLLPPELKKELRWIYDQRVLAQQDFHVVLEHDKSRKLVKLRGTVNRTLRNISAEKTEVRVGGGTDEWFNGEKESEIDRAQFTQNNRVTRLAPRKTVAGVSYEHSEQVVIPAGESIDIFMSYVVTLPDHGQEILTYQYPIDSPRVTVDAPESLYVNVAFSHRTKYDEDSSSIGSISKRLPGVLIPHQDIVILWHSADDVNQRKHVLSVS